MRTRTNIFFATLIISIFATCRCDTKTDATGKPVCSDNCNTKIKNADLSCKLTTPELQKRKETVLASLKKQIIEKKELKDGWAFKFNGTDSMVDELTEFIKTERECCNFFTFKLSITGDKSAVWLELTGADGVKEMITTELEL